MKEVSTRISERCSLKNPDVFGVLIALIDEFPQLLMDNYSIQLGDLGIFTLHAGAKGSETKDEATGKKFTRLKIAFRPGKDIKKKLRTASFKRCKNSEE